MRTTIHAMSKDSDEEDFIHARRAGIEKLKLRDDGLGAFARIQVGMRVRLPRTRADGTAELVEGVLALWSESELCRGFTWDMTYMFEGEEESTQLGVIINPGSSDQISDQYWHLTGDGPKKLQFCVGEEFCMSVSRATDHTANTEGEGAIAC